MKWFLAFLEKRGRKFALVDFTGNVIAYRYLLLWHEVPGKENRLPNIYIHHHLDHRGVDGSSGTTTVHNHPWHVCVFILSGGYTEWRTHGNIKRSAKSFYCIPYTERHAVLETIPGTWTIFAHWFKQAKWAFSETPCDITCDKCKGENIPCEKGARTAGLDEIVDDARNSRKQSWQRVTPEFEKRMARRRKAIAKLAVEVKAVSPVEFAKK